MGEAGREKRIKKARLDTHNCDGSFSRTRGNLGQSRRTVHVQPPNHLNPARPRSAFRHCCPPTSPSEQINASCSLPRLLSAPLSAPPSAPPLATGTPRAPTKACTRRARRQPPAHASPMAMTVAHPAPPAAPDAPLREVFALARGWVFDFLWRSPPSADLSVLSAPTQIQHALTAEIVCRSSPSGAALPNSPKHFSARWYQVPAFSTANLSVGISIQEQERDPAGPSSKPALNLKRYVRDNDTGTMLSVSYCSRTGDTFIDYMTHRSSVHRIHVHMRFDTDDFQHALSFQRSEVSAELAANALCLSHVTREHRPCPKCNAPPDKKCGCTLLFKRPDHPLDFRFDKLTMRTHAGDFDGTCTLNVFRKGERLTSWAHASRSKVWGGYDPSVALRLGKWAMQDRIAMMQAQPANMIMPPGAEAIECCRDEDAILRDVDDFVNFTSEEPALLPVTLDPIELDQILNVDVDLIDVHGAADGLVAPTAEPGVTGSRSFLTTTASTGVSVSLQTRNYESSPMLRRSPAQPIESGGGDNMNTWLAEEERDATEEGGTEGEAAGSQEELEAEFMDFAEGGVQEQRLEENGETQLSERERRMLLRKQRNRESAARANLRRKMKNDSLKLELAMAKKKADALRTQENVLREENMRLRSRKVAYMS